MNNIILSDKPLVLASGSPRRKEILAGAGFTFEVILKEIEETYPATLPVEQVPQYLAELKATAYAGESENAVILTADTVVCLDGKILGKPKGRTEAIAMLKSMSGKKHEVVSGVCFFYKGAKNSFSDVTGVYFKELSDAEIDYYVDNYQPYDKAGAYGIQEWIGMTGIEKITGSYYNVMGLPIHLVYKYLKGF